LAGLIILFGALKPGEFLNFLNLRNILVSMAVVGVVAAGQTVVFALNDFDMSVGSTMSMVGIIVASLMAHQHLSWPLSFVIGLAVGCAAGAFNGVAIAYGNLHPFITTMGTMTAYRGIAYLYGHGSVIQGLPKGFLKMGQGKVGPIPNVVIIVVGISVVAFFVMERTTLGRRWYAVGGNYAAAYLAGIRVRRLRFLAFVACGAAAALGGMMLAGRIGSAHPLMGDPYTLNAITAVFLGMTAFKEGLPNMGGTVVGALFVAILVDGLAVNSVNDYIQQIITGAVVIGAIALAGLSKRQRA
jgi:ribose transport system permease protein